MGASLLGLVGLFISPHAAQPDFRSAAVVAALGALLVAAGFLTGSRPFSTGSLIRALNGAAAVTALQIAVATVLSPLWTALFSRVHRLPPLAEPLAWLCGAFGLSAGADSRQAVIGVANERYLLQYAVNAEALALHPAVLIATAAALLLYLSRARAGAWLGMGAAIAGFVVLRYVALVFWYASALRPQDDHHLMGWFHEPSRLLISFVPLVVVLASLSKKWIGWQALAELRLFTPLTPRPPLLFGLGVLALTLALLLVDPGRAKPGRILIDDVHSGDWEPTKEALNPYEFGSMSVYNVTSLRDFLAYHYPSVEVLREGALTERVLRDVDVLMLKTLTRPLSSAEIQAVEKFVEAGGGLWLIGDHTNLLGMGTYTNTIATRFGIRFRYDACNSLSTGYFGEWRPPLLVRHPVMERVPWFRLLTSATLELDWRADQVMVARDLLSDPIDYSKPSFFGDISPDPSDDFGVFPIAAASRLGRGRVLAFADSTVLSSFALFKEGHIEFAMASVDYLNRENLVGRWPNALLFVIGGLLIVLTVGRLRSVPSREVPTILLIGLVLGASGGAFLAARFNRGFYDALPPHTPFQTVAFPQRGTTFDLAPAISRILVPPGNEYSTFFVAMQRLGLVPRERHAVDDGIGDEAIALIHPSEIPTPDEAERLRDYVNAGGRLLLMLPDRPPNRAAEAWLARLGVKLRRSSRVGVFEPAGARFADGLIEPSRLPRDSRLDGTELVPLRTDLPLEVHRKRLGDGRLVVVFGATFFSRAGMGHVMEEPDEEMMLRYRTTFFFVHDLLEMGSVPEAPGSEAVRPPR